MKLLIFVLKKIHSTCAFQLPFTYIMTKHKHSSGRHNVFITPSNCCIRKMTTLNSKDYKNRLQTHVSVCQQEGDAMAGGTTDTNTLATPPVSV